MHSKCADIIPFSGTWTLAHFCVFSIFWSRSPTVAEMTTFFFEVKQKVRRNFFKGSVWSSELFWFVFIFFYWQSAACLSAGRKNVEEIGKQWEQSPWEGEGGWDSEPMGKSCQKLMRKGAGQVKWHLWWRKVEKSLIWESEEKRI